MPEYFLQIDLFFLIILMYFLSFYVISYLRSYGDCSGGVHLFPFRTEKLSPPAPMILPKGGKVGRRQFFKNPVLTGFFFALLSTAILLTAYFFTFEPRTVALKN